MAQPNNLKKVCCERLGISNEAYEKTVLFACLPKRVRWLARLLWAWRRSYFKIEIMIIQRIATCGSLQEVLDIYEAYRTAYGFKNARIRMTGQLLSNFAKQFLPRYPEPKS